MSKHLSLLLLICFPALMRATDTLTLEQCRTEAIQNHPLQQRKALVAVIADQQIKSIDANRLPRINMGAQASWQSDVFRFPVDNPLFDVPEIPKDQYKLTLDISERIWDGGSDRYLRWQRTLEKSIAEAQVDVDVHQLRATVTDLFAQALLLQQSEAVLDLALLDLERRARQTAALVEQGVALRTAADQVQVQILKTTQQKETLRADRQAALQLLAVWMGRTDTQFLLKPPASWDEVSSEQARPEYRLIDLQFKQVQLGRDMLRLRHQPRFEAFAQGGLGRPNPFNFFETGLQPFAIFGLRAAWAPFDWGTTRRDREVMDLQAQQIQVGHAVFNQSRAAAKIRSATDAAKFRSMLQQDDALIALQADIVRRAETQVEQGVITMTDYLAQADLLTQARLTREAHRIQAWHALERNSQL